MTARSVRSMTRPERQRPRYRLFVDADHIVVDHVDPRVHRLQPLEDRLGGIGEPHLAGGRIVVIPQAGVVLAGWAKTSMYGAASATGPSWLPLN